MESMRSLSLTSKICSLVTRMSAGARVAESAGRRSSRSKEWHIAKLVARRPREAVTRAGGVDGLGGHGRHQFDLAARLVDDAPRVPWVSTAVRPPGSRPAKAAQPAALVTTRRTARKASARPGVSAMPRSIPAMRCPASPALAIRPTAAPLPVRYTMSVPMVSGGRSAGR
jgi:hypothetical protein